MNGTCFASLEEWSFLERLRCRSCEALEILGRLPERSKHGHDVRPDTAHGLRIVHEAVLDREADLRRVSDVVQRIGVEDDEVGELSCLERADVAVEADLLRRNERRLAQRLQVAEAAHLQSPELPLRTESLAVAVR